MKFLLRIGRISSEIFEHYVALAREAAIADDRIAAENLYQHAEHYLCINNAGHDGNQQGTPPRPTTPADVEMNSSEAGPSGEYPANRSQPRWDDDQAGL